METKQIKISELVPQGYEIDLKNSTILNITLKPIKEKLPTLLSEIKGLDANKYDSAFTALMKLVYFRDAWNGDWRADWEDIDNKYCISFYRNKLETYLGSNASVPLHFKTRELAEKFAEQFKDLINEAKELL